MEVNATGIAFIAENEGLRLKSYFDGDGYAIGYGHHGPEVSADSEWTPTECYSALISDATNVSKKLSSLITASLSQGQYNALVDFAYNVGVSAFASSGVLESINSNNFSSVPIALSRWIYSDHHVSDGLIARRKAEIALWNKASQTQDQTSAKNTSLESD